MSSWTRSADSANELQGHDTSKREDFGAGGALLRARETFTSVGTVCPARKGDTRVTRTPASTSTTTRPDNRQYSHTISSAAQAHSGDFADVGGLAECRCPEECHACAVVAFDRLG